MALIWTVAVAGSIEKAPTVTSNQQVKIDKAQEAAGQKAAVDEEMTPEKAARIADEASRVKQLLSPYNSAPAGAVPETQSIEVEPPQHGRLDFSQPVSVVDYRNAIDRTDENRMRTLKADGVIDASELEEYEQFASEIPVMELPVPLTQISETEPNDDCISANSIACGDTVWCADVGFGTDTNDYFTFTLDATYPSWLVSIETFSAGTACGALDDVDTRLELLNSDCSVSLAFNDDYSGLYSFIGIVLAPGTYVINLDRFGTSSGYYHMSLICEEDTCYGNTPPNDNCEDVTPVALTADVPYTFTGNNVCATNQCPSFPGPHVWIAFTTPIQGDVSLEYCNSTGVWGNCWLNMAYGCPCDSFTVAAAFGFTCSDGNVQMQWNSMPAGTYYYPVMLDPGFGSIGDYSITVEVSTPPVPWNCIDDPPNWVPPDGKIAGGNGDIEPNDTCADAVQALCEYAYCGDISSTSDYDWYYIDLPTDGYYGVHVRVFGDDTRNQYAYGLGLDPRVELWAPNCDHMVTYSEDYYGTFPDAEVYDSQINPGDLNCFPPGSRVYINIWTYYSAPGPYLLIINCEPCELCNVNCPPGGIAEGEPDCYDDYEDVTNGGCNSTPNVWGSIAPGDTICGTTGDYTYQGSPGYRDTDWFQFTLTQTSDISATICSETNVYLYLLDASDCNNVQFLGTTAYGSPCDTVTASALTVPPGTYVVWVGSDGSGFPCGSDYWVTLQSTPLTGDWRCCYGDPYAPSCIDTDELTCYGTYNGEWAYGLTCANNPCPAIPANDSCQNAITVAVPSDTYGSTLLATPDTTEVCAGYSQYANSVWYKVIGTGNTITATLCDPVTDYDTELLVWCNSCDYPICVTSNDDDPNCTNSTLQSTVTWCSEQGTEYLVLVGGFSTSSGSFMLHVYDDGTPCSPPPDCAAPIGRCCYNDDQACADNTHEECDALAGSWDGTKNCTDDPCICPESEIIVEIFTDNYPDETTWDLTDSLGTILATGGPLSNIGTLYSWQVCVDSVNCYYFTIYDAYGDGICCDWGQGYYNVYLDGNLVATGGQFGSFETTMFGPACVMPTGACCVDEQCVATNTENECDVLGGSWFLGESCPDFQCPPPPLDCANAEYSNGIDDFVDVYASQCDPANVFVVETADDFVLAADANITTISAFVGFWWNAACGIEGLTGITAVIYNDNGGVPGGNPVDSDCSHTGNVVWEHYFTPGDWVATDIGGPSGDHQIDLPTGGVALTAGTTYWLGIMTHFDLVTCGQAGWTPTLQQTGSVPLLWSTYFGIYWTDPFGYGQDMAFCLHTAGGGGCDYIVGDVNGSNNYNGLDITYGVNFFKYGNPPPQCNPDCPPCAGWHYCGDVNNSCNYNGLDITYGVNYFKYGSPAPIPCDDCPPVGLTGENREPETPQVIKSKTINPKGSDAK